jgi:hypothetical protein
LASYNRWGKKADENTSAETSNDAFGIDAGLEIYDGQLYNGTIKVGGYVGVKNVSINQGDSTAGMTDISLGAYSGWFINGTEVRGILSVGQQSFNVRRAIDVDGKEILKSTFDTQSLRAAIEGAQRLGGFETSKVKADIKVIGGFGLGYTSNNNIKEKAEDGLEASVDADTYTRFNAKIGLGIDGTAGSKTQWYAKLFLNALLVGETAEYKINVSAIDHMSDEESKTFGAKERDRVLDTAFGASHALTDNLSLTADFTLTPSDTLEYSAGVGASYKF